MKKAEIIKEMRKGTQAPTIVCWGRGKWELSWTAPMEENFQGVFFVRTPAIDFASLKEARNWLNEAMEGKGFAAPKGGRAHVEMKVEEKVEEKSEVEKMIEKFSITLHNGGKNIKVFGEYNKAELVFLKTRKQEIIDFLLKRREENSKIKDGDIEITFKNNHYVSGDFAFQVKVLEGVSPAIYKKIGSGYAAFFGDCWFNGKERFKISDFEKRVLTLFQKKNDYFDYFLPW